MSCGSCKAHREAIKQAVTERNVPKIISTTVKAVDALAKNGKARLIAAGYLHREK